MSINDATPADWDRLRGLGPALEKTGLEHWGTAIADTSDDMVNHPNHYTYGNIECIEGIEASMTAEAFQGYCKGACLKYLWRYERKGKPLEDLQKAQWYLNKLIEVMDYE
jgi:hypothetical protein